MTYPQGAKIQCPQCNKWWIVPAHSPGLECNCHLICPDGETPDDCSVTAYRWTGSFGWPNEAHGGADDYSDDRRHATGYCSTHSNYVHRQLQFIEINWKEYFKTRLPRSQRVLRTR